MAPEESEIERQHSGDTPPHIVSQRLGACGGGLGMVGQVDPLKLSGHFLAVSMLFRFSSKAKGEK